MDLNDVFTLAASLKAQDLKRARKLQSQSPSTQVVDFDDGKKTGLAVSASQSEERLICNKTNGSTIGDSVRDKPRRMDRESELPCSRAQTDFGW